MKKLPLLAIVFAALAGCVWSGAWQEAASQSSAPLKIAVFVGDGARGTGAYRWLEIASTAENATAAPVDGAAIRAGALDDADVLIMPGGRAHKECIELGSEGCERVKAFVRGGGGYIGTCAGFYLISQPDPSNPKRKDYLGLIPFKDTASGGNGRGELTFEFNEKAAELAGIKKGKRKILYSFGPVAERSEKEVEGTHAETVATFASNYNPKNESLPSKAGHAAAVAAECGKGRIFALVCHPEYDVDDSSCIEGAFRYVTRGREVRWRYPQRKAGQMAVGVLCDESMGVETARFVQKILAEREFDFVPIVERDVAAGELRHLDAVLAPADCSPAESKVGIYGDNESRTAAFLARGARIFAWGNAVERARKAGIAGVTSVADGEAAMAALRDFAAEPVAKAKPVPGKVARPVKAAVFAGDGCSMGNIPQMLEFSPEYEVGIVGGSDIAAGALAKYDVLYMPGGYSAIAYATLGKKGRKALVDYVRGGGRYYGVCGGAFLVSRTKMTPGRAGQVEGNTPFLGLVPYKDDKPHPYRGKAPVGIRLTKEGGKLFPESEPVRMVGYAGGPVFVDAENVEDSAISVFAKYDSRVVSTASAKPSPDMKGKAAIVGGRVGKGKIYAQCPHPEFNECSFDLVRDAFKWLVGSRPDGTLPHRVRGAKSVVVKMGFRKGMNAAVRFVLKTLLHDRRFDCRVINAMDYNLLPHADAVVFCLFDKDSWTPELKRFAANGGKVVFVAETKAKRKVAEKFQGATVVDSYDKVVGEIK